MTYAGSFLRYIILLKGGLGVGKEKTTKKETKKPKKDKPKKEKKTY